jgi:hypothetical protein
VAAVNSSAAVIAVKADQRHSGACPAAAWALAARQVRTAPLTSSPTATGQAMNSSLLPKTNGAPCRVNQVVAPSSRVWASVQSSTKASQKLRAKEIRPRSSVDPDTTVLTCQ